MTLTDSDLLRERQHLPALERAWTKECRSKFLPWCIEALDKRGFQPAAHHRLLIKEIDQWLRGLNRYLMIFAPPGSAKSTLVTHLLAPHIFARFPGAQIIGASHTSNLAERFSSIIHGYIDENQNILGYGLKTDAKGEWSTTNGGYYLAAGVGAGIPGFRANFVIIDDPIKGRQDADSETRRDTIWNWFNGDLERRMTPGAPIVVMHTRWHEDDLAGRLLQTQPDKWRVICLRAKCEAGDADPLNRRPGEYLWGDDGYGYAQQLREFEQDFIDRGATREWSSQYQQHPRPLEGSIFKIGMIQIIDAVPPGMTFARGWDLAATSDAGGRDPDRTSGIKLLRADDGRFVICDDVTFTGGPDEVERMIVGTASQDGRGVRIGFPQDPGQAGKAQVLYYGRQLAGYIIDSQTVTGDKATRAAPVASQCNIGNLYMVKAPWNRAVLDELAAFPSGAHDDRVDALAEAFRLVGLGSVPYQISGGALSRLRR